MKLTRQQRLGLLLTGILLVLLALLFALTEPPRVVEPTVVEPEPEQLSVPKPEKEKKPRRSARQRVAPRPAPEPRNPLDEEF